MSTYTDIEDLIEPAIAQIKEWLDDLNLFDDISEGEKPLEPDQVQIAWVVHGPDRIASSGMSLLEHRVTIYVIMLNTSTDATLPEMRAAGQQVYNKIMADITLGGTCWVCLPRLFHPGFLQFGEATYCGVLTSWEARFHQPYTPPSLAP